MLLLEFIAWVIATLSIVTITVLASRRFGVEIAIGIFATLTVVANLVCRKLVVVGNFIVPAGVIVYSSTFLVTDIISEIYGKEKGKRAVICGLLANIVMLISVLTVLVWTPANIPGNLEVTKAFETVFSLTPRIVFASIVAYFISQMHDVYAFHFWKVKTHGKHLWLRNNASTIVSQAIDTTVFITLAFYGVVPNEVLFSMIFGQYVIKVLIALLDTPFMYLATAVFKDLQKAKMTA
jgi:uncharacterized integral membrane protein (TIGR00697 family)